MEIHSNVTIQLNYFEIKDLIIKHLKEKGYTVESKDISFIIHNVCNGQGTNEHYQPMVTGCAAHCTKKEFK